MNRVLFTKFYYIVIWSVLVHLSAQWSSYTDDRRYTSPLFFPFPFQSCAFRGRALSSSVCMFSLFLVVAVTAPPVIFIFIRPQTPTWNKIFNGVRLSASFCRLQLHVFVFLLSSPFPLFLSVHGVP